MPTGHREEQAEHDECFCEWSPQQFRVRYSEQIAQKTRILGLIAKICIGIKRHPFIVHCALGDQRITGERVSR